MNLEEIRQLLELVREHELAELELERDGTKIRVRREIAQITLRPVAEPATSPSPPEPGPTAAPVVAPAAGGRPTELDSSEADGIELAVVKSPIVGTFYRSPDPSGAPFVEIGDIVRKGQALCIIEAMKLMNEIESEYDGEVVNIYVENGQPVQYGERLFAIRTR